MPWNLILNWRVIFAVLIAVTLATSHWKAYVAGKNAVIKQAQAEAMANEQAARQREHHLIAAKHKAEEDYATIKRTTQRAIAGAQSELGRLRDTLAARQAAPATTTSAGTDAAAPVERELFGQCAEALADMAGEAGRHAATLTGLQTYVRGVCLAPE